MKYTNFLLMLVGSFSLQAQTSNPAPMFQDDVFIWSNSVYQSTAPVYAAEDKIYIANTVGSITDINPSVNQQFKAGELIKINDAVISPNSSASAQFKIEKSQIQTAWYTDYNNVSKFYKVELGYKLPAFINSQVADFLADEVDGINPFDPSNIDLKVNFIAPNGEVHFNYGFYFQPALEKLQGIPSDPDYMNHYVSDTTSFPWRVRFCPTQVGFWTAQLTVTLSSGTVLYSVPQTFYCAESNHRGFVEAVPKAGGGYERWLRTSDDGKDFVMIGSSISSPLERQINNLIGRPSSVKRQKLAVQKLIDADGNYTRFDISSNGNPEWSNCINYIGQMHEMASFDDLVSICDNNGVYYTIFRHHIEVDTQKRGWARVGWQNNPYKLRFNITQQEYIDGTPEVEKWQKNNVRYIMARWGYSSNNAMYSFSEKKGYAKAYGGFDDSNDDTTYFWHGAYFHVDLFCQKIFDYVSLNFNRKPILMESDANNNVSFEYGAYNCDYVSASHSYGSELKNTNWDRQHTVNDIYNYYNKPVFFEEIGLDRIALHCCTDIDYVNDCWATAFMGTTGPGLNWWWDRGIFDFNYQVLLKNLNAFFKDENLIALNYHPEKWDNLELSGSVADGDWARKHRKIENYHLVAENKESALGWVHNSTMYWRNNYSSCIENMLNGTEENNPPCHCASEPNAFPWDLYIYAPYPQQYRDLYLQDVPTNLNNLEYRDNWSDDWGRDYSTSGLFSDEKMVVENLKPDPIFNKHWYRIDFYEPTGPLTSSGDLVLAYTKIEHTNTVGRLNIDIDLPKSHPSYAYKVTYIGNNDDYDNYSGMIVNDSIEESKNQTATDTLVRLNSTDELLQVKENSVNKVDVFPNPSSNVFTINSTKVIDKVVVYSITGQFLIEKTVNDKTFILNLENFPANNYVLDIRFIDGDYYTHKIQKL